MYMGRSVFVCLDAAGAQFISAQFISAQFISAQSPAPNIHATNFVFFDKVPSFPISPKNACDTLKQEHEKYSNRQKRQLTIGIIDGIRTTALLVIHELFDGKLIHAKFAWNLDRILGPGEKIQTTLNAARCDGSNGWGNDSPQRQSETYGGD